MLRGFRHRAPATNMCSQFAGRSLGANTRIAVNMFLCLCVCLFPHWLTGKASPRSDACLSISPAVQNTSTLAFYFRRYIHTRSLKLGMLITSIDIWHVHTSLGELDQMSRSQRWWNAFSRLVLIPLSSDFAWPLHACTRSWPKWHRNKVCVHCWERKMVN